MLTRRVGYVRSANMPRRFRYVSPKRKGRWRDTVGEARESAVRARVASKDERGMIWLHVFTEIEWRDEP